MSILFVHDEKFKKEGPSFYSSGGGFPSAIWKRYTAVFSAITVVGRQDGFLNQSDSSATLSSEQNVSFKLLPNISNLKSYLFGSDLANKYCEDLVSSHDAVIARLPSRLGQLFVKEAKRQNKPYAIEIVGCPLQSFWNHGSFIGKILAPIEMLNLRKVVAKAPYILYVTENFLQNRYPALNAKTTHCSNVEIASVDEKILKNKLKSFISLSDRKFVFGLIGNYSARYKGIDTAISALAIANKDLPDWKLEIVGSGDSTKLKALAEKLGIGNKVEFKGSLSSGGKVFEWLDTIDIYLQPSLTEGLPRALIEAMSRGCPALATSVGGIPELLSDEQMVKAGDYKALSDLIKVVSSDKKLLLFLSKKNFEISKKYYLSNLDSRRKYFWIKFRGYIYD